MDKKRITESAVALRKKSVHYQEFEFILNNLTDYQFYGAAAQLGILPKDKNSIEEISKDREKIQKDLVNIYVSLSRPSRRDLLFFLRKLNKNNRGLENGEEN